MHFPWLCRPADRLQRVRTTSLSAIAVPPDAGPALTVHLSCLCVFQIPRVYVCHPCSTLAPDRVLATARLRTICWLPSSRMSARSHSDIPRVRWNYIGNWQLCCTPCRGGCSAAAESTSRKTDDVPLCLTFLDVQKYVYEDDVDSRAPGNFWLLETEVVHRNEVYQGKSLFFVEGILHGVQHWDGGYQHAFSRPYLGTFLGDLPNKSQRVVRRAEVM